jgi:hypothetical protein
MVRYDAKYPMTRAMREGFAAHLFTEHFSARFTAAKER